MKIPDHPGKIFFLNILIVSAILLLTACASQGPTFRPSQAEFKSQSLEIKMGTLTGKRGGKPELLLKIFNKKTQDLWVKVIFKAPEPNQSCVIRHKIQSANSTDFICPQQTVVADTPYPIFLEVFSDRDFTNLLEKNTSKMQFPRQEAMAFMKWLSPPELPATFRDIIYTEEFGMSNAFFGAFQSSGSLLITQDNIRYNKGNTTIDIPASRIVSVTQRQIQPGNVWVVVEYRKSGTNRIIGFQGSAFSGSTDIGKLHSTLSYIMEISRQP